MNENNIDKVKLPVIEFDTHITDLIMELEKLRYKVLIGSTHPLVFAQIKSIFHMLESIGSSRIEGNNTTIMDYVETTKIQEARKSSSEQIEEIANIENAAEYIEENIDNSPITMQFVRELHQLVVEGLSANKEGCDTPGVWRNHNVRISGSQHTPPDYTQVAPLMQELIDFINEDNPPKYDLIKICVAHHRFVWIHPFSNGNGRTVRLFTYAMLLKTVFKDKHRIINPTAVFCSNRDEYYKHLSLADEGSDNGMILWSEYVLEGLKTEIEKIDKLIDYLYLKDTIIRPALKDALAEHYISQDEYSILNQTINADDQQLSAGNLKEIFKDKTDLQISRMIKKLVEKKMLSPVHEKARKYIIRFGNNYLLRSILKILDKNGFLPVN